MVILASNSTMSKKKHHVEAPTSLPGFRLLILIYCCFVACGFLKAFPGPIHQSDGVRFFKAPFRRIPIRPHLPRLIARGSSSWWLFSIISIPHLRLWIHIFKVEALIRRAIRAIDSFARSLFVNDFDWWKWFHPMAIVLLSRVNSLLE